MFFPLKVEVEQEGKPIGTWALIGLNCAAFASMLFLSDPARLATLYLFGFVPETGSPLTVLTHMFMHAGWIHVLGNMYFLWVFGRAAELELGAARYVCVYLGAGVVAVVTHAATVLPAIADVPCVGASGAISGVLGAFLVVLPTASVRCALTISMHPHIVTVPAWVFVGVWVALQFVNQKFLSDPSSGTGVAYAAHIGGFAFGWFATSGAKLIRDMAAEWRAAGRMARQERLIADDDGARAASGIDKADPRTQQLVFVKHGVIPSSPGAVSAWIDRAPPERWMDAATYFLRLHLAGQESAMAPASEVKGAKALADLGHLNCAVSCLMDRLETAEGADRQQIYVGLAGLLQQDGTTRPAAEHCLKNAIDIDPSSWFGRTAQEALIRLPGRT